MENEANIMRYAVIQGNKVVNVVVLAREDAAEYQDEVGNGVVELAQETRCGPGYVYNPVAKTFAEPPEESV